MKRTFFALLFLLLAGRLVAQDHTNKTASVECISADLNEITVRATKDQTLKKKVRLPRNEDYYLMLHSGQRWDRLYQYYAVFSNCGQHCQVECSRVSVDTFRYRPAGSGAASNSTI